MNVFVSLSLSFVQQYADSNYCRVALISQCGKDCGLTEAINSCLRVNLLIGFVN